MTEYEKRALDPCWQHKQTCVCPLHTRFTQHFLPISKEDNTYYWQHCRKEAEDDLFVDADNIQLELFRSSSYKEFIIKNLNTIS